MKYLGIDYGTKRVGIATSDDGGTMAFPLRVIPNTRALMDDLLAIIREEHIEMVVLGESHDLMGNPNPLQLAISALAYELRQQNISVVFMSEVYSSREATHLQGDNAMNDASAAAIVLQSYLDKINPPRETSHEEA